MSVKEVNTYDQVPLSKRYDKIRGLVLKNIATLLFDTLKNSRRFAIFNIYSNAQGSLIHMTIKITEKIKHAVIINTDERRENTIQNKVLAASSGTKIF